MAAILPFILDDTGVGSGIMLKHCHTLPQGLPEMGCCYSIAWQRRDGIVIPSVTRGLHKFLDESSKYTFRPNQGYVGRISEALDSTDHEVISNMFFVDPRAFVRKQSALLNGISSVLFIPHSAGVLLEIGFSRPNEAEDSLPLLLTSHALAMDQCILTDMPRKLSFTSTNRKSRAESRTNNSALPRTRSPSPAHAQNTSWWPSIGSQGHPLCCQLPCKYVGKKKGCKDGLSCTRCHLCQFSKSGARHSFKLESECKSNAVAITLSTVGVSSPVYLGDAWRPQD